MMSNEVINGKITEIELLEAKIKELKAMVDATKSELKAEIDSRNVDMIDTGSHRIFYEAYDKKSVDTKKLKDAGLYDEYSKTTTSIMFKITSITND